MDFRDELHSLIERTGRKKGDFAKEAGVSVASIRRLRTKAHRPRVKSVRTMCIALGLTEESEQRFVRQAQELFGVEALKSVPKPSASWRDELTSLVKQASFQQKDLLAVGLSKYWYYRLMNKKTYPKPVTVSKVCRLLKLGHGKSSFFVGQARAHISGPRKKLPPVKPKGDAEKFVEELIGKEPKAFVYPKGVGVDNLILRSKKIIEHLQQIQNEAAAMEKEYTAWLHGLAGASAKVSQMRDQLREVLYSKNLAFDVLTRGKK